MNQHLETRNSNYFNDSFVTESSEAGLNLNEIKDTLIRKFHLVAGCTFLVTSLALLKINITPPNYTADFELLSEPLNIETKVTSEDDSSRETREQITTVELDQVQLKILKSPRLILRAVESLRNKYPELEYQELIEDLSIEIVSDKKQEQNILLVNYQNSDREKVSDVIYALTKTYLDYSLEKRQSGVKRGIAFLEQQIPLASAQAKEINEQLRSIRKQNDFGEPSIIVRQIASRLEELERELETTNRKIRESRVKSKRLEEESLDRPEKSSIAVNLATPGYIELLNQLRDLDIEISRKSAIFSHQSPVLQSLKQERQKLNALLVEAGADIRRKLDDQVTILVNRQQNIIAQIDYLKSRLEQWATVSGEYNELKQQLNRTNHKLNGFLAQKDALQIDAAQQEAPWLLLTPAREPRLDGVSTINYLVLSSTLGLMLGIGFALLLDKHQKIIYTSTKVEEITSLPILATIPYIPQANQLPLLDRIKFARQERLLSPQKSTSLDNITPTMGVLPVKYSHPSVDAFRSFAANLGLLSFDTGSATNLTDNLQSVVITSAIPQEGKSTVALNLAKASASMGKQVLLVDADFRSSDRLTTDLGFESHLGLKDVLSQNTKYPIFNCIQQLPCEENLFILTSGFIHTSGLGNGVYESAAQDHSRLLASEKMHDLMEELEAQFDLVIYDLCSIIGLADVSLIAAQTDGIVLVTGLGKIHSVALTTALNQLRLCNARVLGIAINKVVNQNAIKL